MYLWVFVLFFCHFNVSGSFISWSCVFYTCRRFPQVIHIRLSILCVKRIAFQLELRFLNHTVWAADLQKVFFQQLYKDLSQWMSCRSTNTPLMGQFHRVVCFTFLLFSHLLPRGMFLSLTFSLTCKHICNIFHMYIWSIVYSELKQCHAFLNAIFQIWSWNVSSLPHSPPPKAEGRLESITAMVSTQ